MFTQHTGQRIISAMTVDSRREEAACWSAYALAEGGTAHACIDRNGRPRRLPPEVRALLVAT